MAQGRNGNAIVRAQGPNRARLMARLQQQLAQGRRLNGPTVAQRRAQSARDRAAAGRAAQAANARLRSIPRGPPKKKGELFTTGALKSFQFAPRGHGYYDAFANTPDSACVSATTGPATVIQGYTSDTITGLASVTGTYDHYATANGTSTITTTPHTGNAALILFNPGASDGVVAKVRTLAVTSAGLLHVVDTPLSCAQFEDLGPTIINGSLDVQHHDGDPLSVDTRLGRRVESIPLRGSIRIRNITEALAVGGVVRIMRYNGGLEPNHDPTSGGAGEPESGPGYGPGATGAARAATQNFLSLCNIIRDSPRSKVFAGSELLHMHQSNSYPADFVRSMAFEKDVGFEEALASPAYCTVCILVDDYVASSNLRNNTYEVNVRVQKAARFGPGTLLYGMQKTLRVNPAVHNNSGEAAMVAAHPVTDSRRYA